jgi:hypothetical protein
MLDSIGRATDVQVDFVEAGVGTESRALDKFGGIRAPELKRKRMLLG